MTLYRISDLYPDYKDRFFDGEDITKLDVYSGRSKDEKVGHLDGLLVDETGRFRYLVIDTGFWVFGKKVLLPIGHCNVDTRGHRVYTDLTKDQVEHLPKYDHDTLIDRDYEERVRSLYRQTNVETSAPVESSVPVESSGTVDVTAAQMPPYVGTTPPQPVEPRRQVAPEPVSRPVAPQPTVTERYDYDREPQLYGMRDQDHRQFKLYEERLVAEKHRQKTGEVKVSKHVETTTDHLSVPVEREKVVIEVTSDRPAQIQMDGTAFKEGEVAHMDIHEETADIHKEAVVRETVNIRKEVQHDTVQAEDTVRREELDIRPEGNPNLGERRKP